MNEVSFYNAMSITVKELSNFVVTLINQHLLPLIPTPSAHTLSLCQAVTHRLNDIEHTYLYQLK